MIALGIAEAEKTFLEYGIISIPQCEAEAKITEIIRYATQPVFTPHISPAMCVIKREVMPYITMCTVIFADSAPLAFAQVRAPLCQRNRLCCIDCQSLLFCCHSFRL